MVKNANSVSWLARVALMIFATSAVMTFTGCDKTAPAASTAPKSVADYFEIGVGTKVVRMQLAVTSEEMQHGLMERTALGRDDGMLFVYDRPQAMSYWMRNTPTPLDIGFFDGSGKLVEVYPLHPFDETPVKSRSSNLQFALEMNQGWFHENGMKPGTQIDLKALASALTARGLKPEALHLAP